jgi:general secretion pathway protein D
MEPRVHHNKEVTMKLELEVSNITSVNESGQPTIGTREVTTVIRLKDGETNLLAGLLREEDIRGLSTIPGLGAIPGLRKVFGKSNTTERQTDIILTLRPHIIRIPNIQEEDVRPLWVGTERNIRLRGRSLMPGYGKGPFGQEAAEEAWEVFGAEEEKISPQEIEELLKGTEPEFLRPELREPGEEGPPALPEGEPEAAPREASRRGGTVGTRAPEAAEEAPAAEEPVQPVQQRPVAFSVLPPFNTVEVGQTISVEIRIQTAGQEVSHTPMHLVFNPSLLEVADAQEGDFLKQGGRETFFLHSATGNRLILSASQRGSGAGARGTGNLATIVFRARARGRSEIRFEQTFAKGPTLTDLPMTASTGVILIQPAGEGP